MLNQTGYLPTCAASACITSPAALTTSFSPNCFLLCRLFMDMHEDRHCRSRLSSLVLLLKKLDIQACQLQVRLTNQFMHLTVIATTRAFPSVCLKQQAASTGLFSGNIPGQRGELTNQEISTVNACVTAAFLLSIDSLPGCFRRPQRGRAQTHLPRPAAVKQPVRLLVNDHKLPAENSVFLSYQTSQQ